MTEKGRRSGAAHDFDATMAYALLWFHAFKRNSPETLLDALRNGCKFNPKYGLKTQGNEVILSISPNCVYAYLGKTREAFGKCAIAVSQSQVDGVVSPFDTGGTVAHIGPVCHWTNEERRTYLAAYSWPSGNIASLLEKYPGAGDDVMRAYLAGERPSVAGPHIVWERTEPLHIADVWLDGHGGDERSYLWELRAPTGLPGGDALVRWTCDTDMSKALHQHLEGITDEALATEVAALMERFVEGGTGALVAMMRDGQGRAA